MLCAEPPFKGWILGLEADGSWTPLREATAGQVKAIYDSVCAKQDGKTRRLGRKAHPLVNMGAQVPDA